MAKTGEEVGYADAIRQVQRSLQRRLKALHEALSDAAETQQRDIRIKIAEVEHIVQVVESLHR